MLEVDIRRFVFVLSVMLMVVVEGKCVRYWGGSMGSVRSVFVF